MFNVLYRRRAMIARHLKQRLCLLRFTLERIDNPRHFIAGGTLKNLMQLCAFFEMTHEQITRLFGQFL